MVVRTEEVRSLRNSDRIGYPIWDQFFFEGLLESGGFQHIWQRSPILGGKLFDCLLALKWVMHVQKTSAGLGFQHIGQLFPTWGGQAV